jgi:L-serine dehydratase
LICVSRVRGNSTAYFADGNKYKAHLRKTMQALSVFDMFKIGVGPSSSHTMGPWKAARRFLAELPPLELEKIEQIQVELYGSLAKTGKGHGTDVAVQLGLCGEDPRTIDVSSIPDRIAEIAASNELRIADKKSITFDPTRDITFHFTEELPQHPNGLRITAASSAGMIESAEYFSIGGGFILKEGETATAEEVPLPYPIETAEDLLAHCRKLESPIWKVVIKNELAWRSEPEIKAELAAIKNAMMESVLRGCRTKGILPGGLNVRRRASVMTTKLLGEDCPAELTEWLRSIKSQTQDFKRVLDWVSCFALAVNEENAAFGRVVTAPTNGAAGVIPAVLLYYLCFSGIESAQTTNAHENFLLTAAEIGCIFKKGATISAAMGGCQAEIGVSSAMAAAALTESMGGSPEQAACAAEIAMEHHLGMTCDPIGGLVQIPCIERNAMGAIKAITAAQIALQGDPAEARVSLDSVVRTMWETAQDMNAKYKETSEGGLAIQISVNVSEC